ncbi:T9SS type A sorting domain-containing protein [Mangrovimonas aestuarii]|uniref:T9SS type A sorting domain-containing protein n=1 Tax=Mangrovimonas aestuarii TaxID=3018443 RepID=UPI0023787EBF|nr:T9SS type A sorting domain-containing protein [Mangrovimonas aestuarii]
MKAFKYFTLSIFTLFFINTNRAQSVDLVSYINESAPFIKGEYINYTIEAVANDTLYNSLQIKLHYNPNALELVELNTEYNFDAIIINDTSTSGEVKFAAGDLGSEIYGRNRVFTITFRIINPYEPILIKHDLINQDRSIVCNKNGKYILGKTNDIIIERSAEGNDSSFLSQLQLYPNPASKKFFIKSNHFIESINTIELFDLNGKFIKTLNNFESNDNTIIINTETLDDALYFLTVNTYYGTKRTFRVIVKN